MADNDKKVIIVIGLGGEPLSDLARLGLFSVPEIKERDLPPELEFEPEQPKNRAQRRHPEKF